MYMDGDASYSIAATAVNEDGTFTANTVDVVIENVAPSVNAGADQTVSEGQPVHLTGSYTDPGADTVIVAWTVIASNGQIIPPASGLTFDFTPNRAGIYSITFTATDSDGESGSDVVTVTVGNLAPVANAGADQAVAEGTPVYLSGTFSDAGLVDLSGLVPTHTLSWQVVATNGQIIPAGNGSTFSFVPADQGTYTAIFTVTDEFGATHNDRLVIDVSNAQPVTSEITNFGPIDESSAVAVRVVATDAGGQADPLVYEFDCNDDGTFEVGPQASNSTNCFFGDNGTSNVRVRVSDGDGGVASGITAVVVHNVDPTITSISNSGPVAEGGSAVIFVAAFDPAGSRDPLSYEFDCNDDGNYELAPPSGNSASCHFADSGSQKITVRVTDGDGGEAISSTTVTVTNVAPVVVLSTSNELTVNEGTALRTYSFTIHDPGTDTVTAVTVNCGSSGTQVGEATFTDTSGSFACQFTDGPATSVVSVSATDSDNDTGPTNSQTVTVDNLAPVASISGPASAAIGQTLTFTLTASDASAADQAAGFTFNIDWDGNGSIDQTVTGPSGTQVSHVYATGAVVSVKVTATDRDLGVSAIAAQTVVVSAISVQPDPADPTRVAIVAGGTAGNDWILITPGLSSNQFVVTIISPVVGGLQVTIGIFSPSAGGHQLEISIGGVTVNIFTSPLTGPLNRFIAFGLAGNDIIEAAGSIGKTVELHGGAGDDNMKGGGGHDILLGGEGADLIVGGSGRDLMIGGLGADRMVGNADDDILIAGYTDHDTNAIALRSIMAEWTSARSYNARVANLKGITTEPTFASRLNGNIFLKMDGTTATVHDDAAVDVLTGSAGIDWFLLNLDGDGNNSIKDKITDLSAAEFANDLDFINGA
jgi:Ca2+-binding RTX toxin-like protein